MLVLRAPLGVARIIFDVDGEDQHLPHWIAGKPVTDGLEDQKAVFSQSYPSLPARLEFAILTVALQGDGVPPSEARGFCDWLESSAAPVLPTISYSVCALGDT